MNRKIIALAALLILFFLVSACDSKNGATAASEKNTQTVEKENMAFKVSPENLTVYELATTIYDDEQLLKLSEFKGNINDLNEHYKIECLRYIEKGAIYRATYVGEGKILTFWFNNDGELLMVKAPQLSPAKARFEELTIGQPFDVVYQLDSTSEYDFMNTGRTDAPKVSSHYTSDGWLVHISYDDHLRITGITSELI